MSNRLWSSGNGEMSRRQYSHGIEQLVYCRDFPSTYAWLSSWIANKGETHYHTILNDEMKRRSHGVASRIPKSRHPITNISRSRKRESNAPLQAVMSHSETFSPSLTDCHSPSLKVEAWVPKKKKSPHAVSKKLLPPLPRLLIDLLMFCMVGSKEKKGQHFLPILVVKKALNPNISKNILHPINFVPPLILISSHTNSLNFSTSKEGKSTSTWDCFSSAQGAF